MDITEIESLRAEYGETRAELDEYRKLVRFILDKVVVRHAGNLDSQFAYVWTRHWCEFETRAKQLAGPSAETTHGKPC